LNIEATINGIQPFKAAAFNPAGVELARLFIPLVAPVATHIEALRANNLARLIEKNLGKG